MNRYVNFFYTAMFFSTLVLVFGCGGEVVVEEEEIIPPEELISTDTEIKFDLTLSDIPSPTKLTGEISKSGINYDKSILNSPSSSGKYSTNYQKGVNLGIYVADLSYATVYSQTQDATSYLSVCKQLADGLGISKAFDDDLMKKFQSNSSNMDSLVGVIDDAYKNIDKFFRTDDRVSTAAIVFTGCWIEGLYVSTQMAANSEKTAENASLFIRIGEQKFSLKNILELLNQYADKPDHAKLIELLGGVEKAFLKVPQPSKIDVRQVGAISDAVSELRAQLI